MSNTKNISMRAPIGWLKEIDAAAEALGLNRTAALIMLSRYAWRLLSSVRPGDARGMLERTVGE